MKFREFLLPLVTGLAIFSMSVFISCASTSRIDEDGNEIEETSVSETEPGSSDNLDELPANNEKVAAATPPANESPDTATSNEPPPPVGDLGELPAEQPPVADTLPQESVPPSNDLAANSELPPADNTSLPPEGSSLMPAGDLSTPTQARGAVGTASVPKVPANAIKRGGTLLNRFYFVRQGDTKESIAENIYNDAGKAKSLGKWNKGDFKPGRLVFYQSPSQPDDNEMKPLYQEKGISPVDYTVQKGDWLSRIAAKKLGSGSSWKEIAVLNGIENPSALEVGQKLALYPLNGDAQALAANDVASPEGEVPAKKSGRKKRGKKEEAVAEAPSNPNLAPVPDVTAPQSSEAPLIQAENSPAAPAPVPADAQPPVETFKKKKKNSGFDIFRLIEQNLFFIILGFGVAILAGALVFVNKRRKAKAAEAEFGDDAFASPKAKRR